MRRVGIVGAGAQIRIGTKAAEIGVFEGTRTLVSISGGLGTSGAVGEWFEGVSVDDDWL